MRVPVQQQTEVQASNPYGDTSPNLQQPNMGLAQALGSIGKDVNQVGQAAGGMMAEQAREDKAAQRKALADAEEAKKKAEGLLIADGLVDLQRKVGDDESKFLGKQGLDAVRASGPTLDAFDKHLEDVAARYTDPLQQSEFKVRGKQALLAARRSVETHTTRENAAGTKDTFNNLRSAAIRNAGSIDLSPSEMGAAMAPVDQAADEFLPPELAKAAKVELRADMADATIQRHLDAGRVDQAAKQLELDRGTLGTKRAKNLDAAIDEQRKANTKASEAFSAQAFVARQMGELHNQHGFLDVGDENQARAAVAELTPEKQQVMEPVLERAINVEGERRATTIKAWTQEAKTQRLHGGTAAIDPKLMGRLEQYNPDYVESIREDDQKRTDRLTAKRAGGAKASAADREQARINKLALTRMQGLPYSKQATYEDDVGFDALGLDEQGKANLAKQQQLARNFNDKGFDRAKESLDNDIERIATEKRLKGEAPGSQFEIKADANDELQLFLQKNARLPDATERAKIVSDATLKQATKPRLLDSIRGKGLEFPFQAKKREGAGADAAPVTIRRKSDGKKRTVSAADAKRFLEDPNFELGN